MEHSDSHFGALPDDETLVLRAKARDTASLGLLIARYQGPVRALARGFRAAGLEQEDLIQEALVGLVKAVRSFDVQRGSSFSTYAGLCMRRQLLTAVKSAGAGKHKPLSDYIPLEDASELSFLSPGDSRTASPEALVIQGEEAVNRAQQIQSRLSTFEQSALSLYLAGLSHAEMARRLGVSPKSVDNALQRVRRKLRDVEL